MATTLQEVWTNLGQCVVTAGGADAPAQGTPETLTVTVSVALPACSASASPPTICYLEDPFVPGDYYEVTSCPGGVGSMSLSVTRGADNSTPQTHALPFVLNQVTPGATYRGFASQDANGRLAPQNRDNVSASVFTAAQSAASLVNGTNHRFNCNASSVSQPLPAQPQNGTTFGFSRTDTSTSFTLTITPGSGDTIPTPNPTVVGPAQTIFYTYNAGLAAWNVNSSNLPLSNLLTTSVANTLYASLGVPAYQGSANYVAGQEAVGPNGAVYYALNAITGSPVTFNPAQWRLVDGSPPTWAELGIVASTMQDPAAAGVGFTPTAGTIYFAAFWLRSAQSAFNDISIQINTAGATLTASENFMAIYSSAGTQLGITADQSSNWTSTGLKTMALTSAYSNPPAGMYWVALLSNGTTPPTIRAGVGNQGASSILNVGMAAGSYRVGTYSTLSQTTLPGSFTPSSAMVQTSAAPFLAVVT